MRKIVADALRQKIQSSVETLLPQFEFYNKSMKGDEKGLLRYRWKPKENLSCFIVFRLLSSEGFDVSVGWSTMNRCPFSTVVLSKPDDIWNFSLDEMMVPTIDLANRNGLAHWSFWQPPDEVINNPEAYGRAYAEHFLKQLDEKEALDLVNDAVLKGMNEVIEHGIPYLNKKISGGS
jgi:hypothetical protein